VRTPRLKVSTSTSTARSWGCPERGRQRLASRPAREPVPGHRHLRRVRRGAAAGSRARDPEPFVHLAPRRARARQAPRRLRLRPAGLRGVGEARGAGRVHPCAVARPRRADRAVGSENTGDRRPRHRRSYRASQPSSGRGAVRPYRPHRRGRPPALDHPDDAAQAELPGRIPHDAQPHLRADRDLAPAHRYRHTDGRGDVRRRVRAMAGGRTGRHATCTT
jgi:hypothetical protein